MTIRLTWWRWLALFAESPIMFGRKAAQRIAAVVKRVESAPYPSMKTPTRWPVIAQSGGNVGFAGSGGISARTNTNGTITAGTGMAWIWSTNASTGRMTNTNAEVTVFSISSMNGGIPSGTCIEFSWRGNVLYVDAADCGN